MTRPLPISPYGKLSHWLHMLFEASLVLKGLFAAGETLSGLGLLLTPHGLLLSFWAWATHHQLTPHPTDAVLQWFQHLTTIFPVQVQHFYALYLLTHGVLKFIMVIMLARRILWGYPAAMVLLAGFVIYQASEFVTHGSWVLLALACLDTVMIVLVYREWNVLKLTHAHR